MKNAIRQSQKINSRIHNSRIAIRQRIAQLGYLRTGEMSWVPSLNPLAPRAFIEDHINVGFSKVYRESPLVCVVVEAVKKFLQTHGVQGQ